MYLFGIGLRVRVTGPKVGCTQQRIPSSLDEQYIGNWSFGNSSVVRVAESIGRNLERSDIYRLPCDHFFMILPVGTISPSPERSSTYCWDLDD